MQIENQHRKGIFFVLISAISWGTFGVFSTLCLKAGLTDNTLVALSPLALLVYFAIRVLMKPKVLKGIPFWLVVCMFLHGALIVNISNYAYTQAYVAGMPVAVVSSVVFCQVFVVMIESVFVFKQKITLQKALAAVLAVVGVSMALGLLGASGGDVTFAGALWTIVAAIFLGTGTVCSSFWLSKNVDSDAFLLILSIGSVLVMFTFFVSPAEFFTNLATVLSERNLSPWLSVFGLILIPNICCYSMMMEGLKRISATTYAIIYSFDPVTATILGMVVFSQIVAPTQIAGILIILFVVGYVNWVEGKAAMVS